MSQSKAQPYQVTKVSVVAKGADVLVREYVLSPGESIMWHRHTEVTDYYYSLEGKVLIETRAPAAHYELGPGKSATVMPPTVHHVSNPTGEPCRFLLIQGVGKYDFVKELDH